jgi:hypothetical protein
VGSSQLAVLASSTVISGEFRRVPVMFFLTGHAQTNACKGLSSRLRNRIPAFRAVSQRCSARQLALRPLDTVFHRRIDLILNRAVARPACSHDIPLSRSFHPCPDI